MKSILLIIILMVVVINAFAQQGLFLSTNRARKSQAETFHETGISSWYQTAADRSSAGFYYRFHKYLPESFASFRLYSGIFGSYKDKLHTIGDFNSQLIKPMAPGWEIGTGFSKLFIQSDNKLELAFNADVWLAYRFPKINDIKSKLTTYHVRTGVELIPFKAEITFYGNVNFILDASGTKRFLQDQSIAEDADPNPLLRKAEYFDVGIKYQIRCGAFRFTPDVNVILAERRIATKSTNGDWVIPNVSVDAAFLFPMKNKSIN